MNRRTFFEKSLLWGIGVFCVGVVAESALAMFKYLMPFQSREALKTFTCFSKDLTEGAAKEIRLRGNKLILINNDGNVMAFSAVCPHLGCSVIWDEKEREFLCPCHMASFDNKGYVLTGPPPGPLSQYKVLIEGNSVFVFVPENYWAQKEV